jgi:hypothetical protein
MLRHTLFAVIGLIVLSAGLFALQGSPSLKSEIPSSDSLLERYTGARTRLQQVAERMPEPEYGFRPTPLMETFAMRIAHVADMNFEDCQYLVGKPNPYQGVDLNAKFTTRSQLMALLQESFAFCDGYMSRLTPAVMAETVSAKAPPGAPFREVKVEKGGVAIRVVAHHMEMYGYLAVYLRLKGIVPPTSSK